MSDTFHIDESPLSLLSAGDFVFGRKRFSGISVSAPLRRAIGESHRHLYTLLDQKVPIYGVNTGFGDSLFRFISRENGEKLQKNLVSYLLCGAGDRLPREAVRGTMLFRLNSLCRGYSGVSLELIDRLVLFLQNDWLPVIPCQGSLGASGDLIPLAYIAEVLQGEGEIETADGIRPTAELLSAHGLTPYRLKPKEGLALVNGTSAMAGQAFVNVSDARALVELAVTATSMLCLALGGRPEAFGRLVNEKAKTFAGQSNVARLIREMLEAEGHEVVPLERIGVENDHTKAFIQDRYSLRCAPQVLGPVWETVTLAERWLETEINGVSDNPLVDGGARELALGGNFYGGYLAHGMDYLKISLAHVADVVDRQLMSLIDEKANRGLPPNLANWNGMEPGERFLHHGLKGLHQAVSAITSEVMAKAMPSSIFSRSSESHNQDKVSLGMSAAVECARMIDQVYTVQGMYLTCLAQALDLKGIRLRGEAARSVYERVRGSIPFVERDTALGSALGALSMELRRDARQRGSLLRWD